MKIIVCYLMHKRSQNFKLLAYFLEKIKPENKAVLEFNFMVTGRVLGESEINKRMEIVGLPYRIHDFGPRSNYMNKVRIIVKEDSDYMIKLDDDIFFNNHVWDYIIENVKVLDDDNNLCLTPLLSNGIPSVEMFVDCFFDDMEKSTLYEMFSSFKMGEKWRVDYSSLSANGEAWNRKVFYDKVRKINHHYKGVHPARASYDIQAYIIERVLGKLEVFVRRGEYGLLVRDFPYFCNSVFLIKTETWRKIVNSESLFRDAYDEVPLNLYRDERGMKIVFINNSFGVHPAYGCVKNSRKIEDEFYKGLKNKLNIP